MFKFIVVAMIIAAIIIVLIAIIAIIVGAVMLAVFALKTDFFKYSSGLDEYAKRNNFKNVLLNITINQNVKKVNIKDNRIHCFGGMNILIATGSSPMCVVCKVEL